MEEARSQKEMSCHFLRNSTRFARRVHAFLRQLPRFFQFAAHDMEKPCPAQRGEQGLWIFQPPG